MLRRVIVSLIFLGGGAAACQPPAEQQESTTSASDVPAAPQLAAPANTLVQPVVAAKNYPYTVPPVNQIPQEPVLEAFVQKILRACAARRQKDLLALVDKDVAVDYGGAIIGKPGFITDFLNSPRPGSGFDRLQQVIQLGGTVSHDSAGLSFATFPYPQDGALYKGRLAAVELDPYISYVGLVPGLVIYRRPTRRSRQIARLDYPVLSTGYDAPELGDDWLRVVAVDSSFQGYAEAKYLYNLASITLTIEQKKGQFKITGISPYD